MVFPYNNNLKAISLKGTIEPLSFLKVYLYPKTIAETASIIPQENEKKINMIATI